MKNQLSNSFSSTLFFYPEDIQVASFSYNNNFLGFHNQYKIKIIDYGNFNDSESGYVFSAKDILFNYNLIKSLSPKFYFCFGTQYFYSNIDNYNSSAIFFNASLLYRLKESCFNITLIILALLSISILILMTFYLFNYSLGISYLPKYLKSSIGLNHQKFDNFDLTNIVSEIYLYDSFSILFGYSSLAQKLYSNDNFEKDFFTGLSAGLNFNYKNLVINFGLKNLGSVGLIQSISLIKNLN